MSFAIERRVKDTVNPLKRQMLSKAARGNSESSMQRLQERRTRQILHQGLFHSGMYGSSRRRFLRRVYRISLR